MVKILALDIAVSTGWAFYDTDKHHTDMELGAFNCAPADKGKRVDDRLHMRRSMDRQLCGLIDRYRPECMCLEQPLASIVDNGQRGSTGKLRYKGELPMVDENEGEGASPTGGVNANAVFALNQLFAVADTVANHKCELVVEVPPKTWQTLTASYPGSTKERSVTFLFRLGIEFPMSISTKKQRHDAADAGVIAFWAAGHCQEVKLLRNARHNPDRRDRRPDSSFKLEG